MAWRRQLSVLLVLIILIKSFHCSLIESRYFLAEAGLSAVAATADDQPRRPINRDGGCESGCLCRGAIFLAGPELPTQNTSMDPWLSAEMADRQFDLVAIRKPWNPESCSKSVDGCSGMMRRISQQSFLL